MKLSNDGIHDGMSICATLIKDFKLKSIVPLEERQYLNQEKACIVESVGRGNCDLPTRDIYFTVTSKTHKIMFVLEKNKLFPVMIFDKKKILMNIQIYLNLKYIKKR